jgi:hypothetical protein
MRRHARGYALATRWQHTRALEAYLDHRDIQHTVRCRAIANAVQEFLARVRGSACCLEASSYIETKVGDFISNYVGPSLRTINSQATSTTRLRLYESAIASRFVFSRKIRDPATFDFCNTINTKADVDQAAATIHDFMSTRPRSNLR